MKIKYIFTIIVSIMILIVFVNIQCQIDPANSFNQSTYITTATITPYDNIKPLIGIINPDNSFDIVGSITIKGTAEDNLGVYKVELFYDDELKTSIVLSNTKYWSYEITETSRGTHKISAYAYDYKNNVSNPAIINHAAILGEVQFYHSEIYSTDCQPFSISGSYAIYMNNEYETFCTDRTVQYRFDTKSPNDLSYSSYTLLDNRWSIPNISPSSIGYGQHSISFIYKDNCGYRITTQDFWYRNQFTVNKDRFDYQQRNSSITFENRHNASSVWTGSEMIIWGGQGSDSYSSGCIYNPITNSFNLMSTSNAPNSRSGHSAVWTGDKMIIWGGEDIITWYDINTLNTGGIYDPTTNIWQNMSNVNAPSVREYHSAIWTGSDMIIWGGDGNSIAEDTLAGTSGGTYNLLTNTWNSISSTGAPSKRLCHTALWTGKEMLIWGGSEAVVNSYGTGGLYNPINDSWTSISNVNAADYNSKPYSIWTGSSMIVSNNTFKSYNPSTDTWQFLGTKNTAINSLLWNGEYMVAVGTDKILRYYPNSNTWYTSQNTLTMTNNSCYGVKYFASLVGDSVMLCNTESLTGFYMYSRCDL